jgi:sulfur-carrier protein adenylyltransferase/sulfurtransferase
MVDQPFEPAELTRYARHLMLDDIGLAGQTKLKASSVLIIGVGGLGSPLAMYLAAAGIGRIGLVDSDTVDLSNLQRQIIHTTDQQHRLKVDSAAATITNLNPYVRVERYPVRFDVSNAWQIAADYDVIIDGTDNFATRYLVNDISVLQHKPNIYGSILRFEGQATVFNHQSGPCYRCIYPIMPPAGMIPSCGEAGVLGVLPGLVGTIQATETIKVLLGKDGTLAGRLLLIDALEMKFRELKIQRNRECPVCGQRATIQSLVADNYTYSCTTDASLTNDKSTASSRSFRSMSVQELQLLRESTQPFTLIDVREDYEYQICNLGGKLIPLKLLEQNIPDIALESTIVVHCKLGGRSAKAAQLLVERGFINVHNLTGGISAWIAEIDSSLPSY